MAVFGLPAGWESLIITMVSRAQYLPSCCAGPIELASAPQPCDEVVREIRNRANIKLLSFQLEGLFSAYSARPPDTGQAQHVRARILVLVVSG
jgi:hypothetical protein